MGTTGIGYPARIITMEQPTSSGQSNVFSSGCKLNMKTGSEIEMESGSTFNMESGSVLNMAGTLNLTGTVAYSTVSASRVPIVQATSAAKRQITLRGGVTFITSSTKWTSNSTKARAFIVQPAKGAFETLICYNSTYIIEIAASSAKTRAFGTVAGKDFTLSIAPTTKMKKYGVSVQLTALSTTVILVGLNKSPIIDSTAFVNDPVTVTTSTLG